MDKAKYNKIITGLLVLFLFFFIFFVIGNIAGSTFLLGDNPDMDRGMFTSWILPILFSFIFFLGSIFSWYFLNRERLAGNMKFRYLLCYFSLAWLFSYFAFLKGMPIVTEAMITFVFMLVSSIYFFQKNLLTRFSSIFLCSLSILLLLWLFQSLFILGYEGIVENEELSFDNFMISIVGRLPIIVTRSIFIIPLSLLSAIIFAAIYSSYKIRDLMILDSKEDF